MRESDIESHGVKYARKLGWYVRKFATPHRRSAPDDIHALMDRVFWIEYKATGEGPTPLQAKEHREMRAKGLTVYVIDSREDARRVIDLETDALRQRYGAVLDAYTG